MFHKNTNHRGIGAIHRTLPYAPIPFAFGEKAATHSGWVFCCILYSHSLLKDFFNVLEQFSWAERLTDIGRNV